MLFSTSSAARRTVARVAAAGAIAAIPLLSLAVPASADPGAPDVTEVHHPHGHHHDDCDSGPFPWWGDHPFEHFRQHRPHGLFGSS